MQEPKKPKDQMQFYKALKIGYTRDFAKQRQALKKYGYVIDPELTRAREQVVAFRPTDKRLLVIENGTDFGNKKDRLTDLALAAGHLKETPRYKEDHNGIMKARQKYKVPNDHIYVIGHSLGGGLTNYITPTGAHGITYNGAFTPHQKIRPEIQNYRTQGDAISAYAPKDNTKIIKNIQSQPVEHDAIKQLGYRYNSHILDNIKNLPVYF